MQKIIQSPPKRYLVSPPKMTMSFTLYPRRRLTSNLLPKNLIVNMMLHEDTKTLLSDYTPLSIAQHI